MSKAQPLTETILDEVIGAPPGMGVGRGERRRIGWGRTRLIGWGN